MATAFLAVGTLANIPGFAGKTENAKESHSIRMTALDYGPNELAAISTLAALVLLASSMTGAMKRRYRFLLAAMAVPPVAVAVRTGSRSAIVTLLLGLAVFLLPGGGTRRRLGVALLAAVFLFGVVLMGLTNPMLQARFAATYYSGDTAGHLRIAGAALEMFSERPILGWGPLVGLSELGSRLQYKGPLLSAHNLPLHLLLEVGIIGTFPFMVGLWLVVRTAWRGRKLAFGLAPLALVATVLTINLAHTFLRRPSRRFRRGCR